jgi:hypothetical protein
MDSNVLKLSAGEFVEVRSLEEILPTLDSNGMMDSLPFMPEMKKFCGKRFKVHAQADRTCVEHFKARGMKNAVWLSEVRCDGSLHDDCKAGCQIFWKEAWLKLVPENEPFNNESVKASPLSVPTRTKEEETGRYICQSSELSKATFHLGIWGNVRSYIYDLRYKNLSFSELLKTIYIYAATKIHTRSPNEECGTVLGDQKKTPAESLNLQPGDWVEVKSPEEIKETLDPLGRNRGLMFARDQLEFCGKRFRVLDRLDKIINEKDGMMIRLNNTVKLDGSVCSGICRRGCKRSGYTYWREIWLKKVEDGTAQNG